MSPHVADTGGAQPTTLCTHPPIVTAPSIPHLNAPVLRLDGFSVLMRAMQQQVQKLKVKSAFLLQNLLVGHPEHKGGAAWAGS